MSKSWLACAAVVAVLVAAVTAAPAARAQSGSTADLEAALVAFPVFVGPEDSLAAVLDVVNKGDVEVGELEVTMTIYRGVTSRSELHRTFAGRLGTPLAVDTIPVEGSLAPDETRRIEVAKPLAELGSFRGSTRDRAYPVQITVHHPGGSTEPISTHMVYFHEVPEKPLGISLVVPLHTPPSYTDGRRPELVTAQDLEQAIAGGRIDRILTGLEQHPDLPVTLAPSGLLLSTLQDMIDGYPRSIDGAEEAVGADEAGPQAARSTLERLRAIAARPRTRVIAGTYSPTSLPALNFHELEEMALAQLAEGRNVLQAEPVGLLRAQPMEGWFLPAFGAVDQATLTQLHRAEIERLIIDPRSVRPVENPFTRAVPMRLEGGPGSVTEGLAGPETLALVSDGDLTEQLAYAGERATVEARQRFVAESATIHLETPGLVRAVVALTPVDWEADGSSATTLMSVIENAPWLAPATPDSITDRISPPAGELRRLASTSSVLEIGPEPPDGGYYDALQSARAAITRYSALAPPPGRIGALSRRLLIAESTDWWTSSARIARGTAFAEAIPVAVSGELAKVQAPSPQTITLTSKTGVIPISVSSGLDYPVDVVLQVESDKLRFPGGNRIAVPDLQPPARTIRVRAITESSGTFPVGVSVLTPAGALVSESQLTIRSTAYNIVALSITGAAGAFLVGWWLVGLLRGRLSRRAALAPAGQPGRTAGNGEREQPDRAPEGAGNRDGKGRGSTHRKRGRPATETPTEAG